MKRTINEYRCYLEFAKNCADCLCENDCPYIDEKANVIGCMTKLMGDMAKILEELIDEVEMIEAVRKEPKTFYICDKTLCNNCSDTYCECTLDPNHAVNGPCEDPWNHTERFEIVMNDIYTSYIEKRNEDDN